MRLKKLITESASKEAMGIAAFTATRGDAVQKFIDDNGIDASALCKYVKNGKMPERMAFVSALVGNPGNKMFKMIVSKFGMSESINQNQINLLKATYGDIKKINPNSPAVKKLMMALKKLSKDDLETLSKAKINFVSTMAQSILRDSNVSESVNEADLNWNAVQNAIINFLKVNTKILDKKVQAKDTEGVKGGLKSIISGLTNAQRSLNLESVNEAKKSTFTKVAHISNNGKLDIY